MSDCRLAVAARAAVERLEVRRLMSHVAFQAGVPVTDEAGTAATGAFVAADFNADGRSDLISVGQAVLISQAGGGFVRNLDLTLPEEGFTTGEAAVSDVNGDGDADLLAVVRGTFVAGGSYESRLRVYLGRGDGTFADPVDTSAGADDFFFGGGGLSVADLTGDGAADVLTRGGESAVLLEGAGDGTFAPRTLFPLPYESTSDVRAVVAADVNGDGRKDAVAIRDGDTIDDLPGSILTALAQPDGTFATPTRHDVPALADPSSDVPVVADVDGDGREELIVSGTHDVEGDVGGVLVLRRSAGGTWAVADRYATDAGYWSAVSGVTASDADGDGRADLLAADPYGVRVLTGRPDGTFTEADFSYAAAGGGARAAVGDFDGDGTPDLAVPGLTGGLLLRGTGDGAFTGARRCFLGRGFSVDGWFDIDGDGRSDLVTHTIADDGTLTVRTRLTRPDGTLAAAVDFDRAVDAGVFPAIVPGDFDGDGRADLALAFFSSSSAEGAPFGLEVWPGNGDGTFAAALQSFADSNLSRPLVADFNDDGRDDLLLLDTELVTDVVRPRVLLGAADGPLAEVASTGLSEGLNLDDASFGDFDGDGRLDLAVGQFISSSTTTVTAVYFGSGDGTFEAPIDVPVDARGTGTPAAGDYDGDGRSDLLGGSQGVVALGRAGRRFVAVPGYPFGEYDYSFRGYAAPADFDGDGRDDLFVDGDAGPTVLRALGDGTFAGDVDVPVGPNGDTVSLGSRTPVPVGDLDADGRPDVAVNDGDGGVTVLLNATPPAPPADAPRATAADPRVGQDGVATAQLTASRLDYAAAAVVQPDGKVILAGTSSGDGARTALARLNPDGTLDTTFGTGGRVLADEGEFSPSIEDLALQPDGRILAVGPGHVARYLPDGSPDSTFGVNGRVYTGGARVAVGPDGTIVVANAFSDEYPTFTVTRLLADGTPDPAFGGEFEVGSVYLGELLDSSYYDVTVAGLSVRPDGKVVAALQRKLYLPEEDRTAYSAVVVRLTPDGDYDATFGGDGRMTINQLAEATVAVGADGRTIVGGRRDGQNQVRVVRLSADGTTDITFAGGAATAAVAAGTKVRDAFVEPDGGVVVLTLVGTEEYQPTVGRTNALRFSPAGAFDDDFAARTADLPLVATSVAAQPGGGFVVAGALDAAGTADFAVVVRGADGSADPAFAAGGVASVDFASARRAYATVAAVQPDGRVVTVGRFDDTEDGRLIVSRRLADGRLDPTFGDGGVVVTSLVRFGVAPAVVVRRDGRIVVAAITSYGSDVESGWDVDTDVLRLNRDGSVDRSFGTDGVVRWSRTDEPDFSSNVSVVLAALSDGRLLLGGGAAVVRLNTDGTFDEAFGQDGRLTVGPASAAGDDAPYVTAVRIAVLPDGRFLLAGGPPEKPTVARFSADGVLDSAFGTGGYYVVDAAALSVNGVLSALAVARDGAVLFGVGGDRELVLFRLTRDGAADPAFGQDGVARLPVEAADPLPRFIIPQRDGGLLVVGTAAGGSYDTDGVPPGRTFVARLMRDGATDTSFGAGGRVFVAGPRVGGNPAAFALARDGSVWVAGQDGGDAAVARLRFVNLPRAATPKLRRGTLRVDGTGGDDAVHVNRAGDRLLVSVNGVLTTFASADVRRMQIRGGEGDDTLVVSRAVITPATIAGGRGSDLFAAGGGTTQFIDLRSTEDVVLPGRRPAAE